MGEEKKCVKLYYTELASTSSVRDWWNLSKLESPVKISKELLRLWLPYMEMKGPQRGKGNIHHGHRSRVTESALEILICVMCFKQASIQKAHI